MSLEFQRHCDHDTTVVYNDVQPSALFGIVKSVAYQYFCALPENTDGINTIILKAAVMLHVDTLDYNGILLGRLTAQEKFLQFASIVESRDYEDCAAQRQFIDFLLNFEELRQLGKQLEGEFVKKFGDQVEVLRVPRPSRTVIKVGHKSQVPESESNEDRFDTRHEPLSKNELPCDSSPFLPFPSTCNSKMLQKPVKKIKYRFIILGGLIIIGLGTIATALVVSWLSSLTWNTQGSNLIQNENENEVHLTVSANSTMATPAVSSGKNVPRILTTRESARMSQCRENNTVGCNDVSLSAESPQCDSKIGKVNRTVFLGKSGQYQEAREEFLKLKDCASQMKSAIIQLYNGDYICIERTVLLCYTADCSINTFCVNALFQEMGNHGHATKPEIFFLDKNLQFQLSLCLNNSQIKETLGMLKPKVDIVLNEWVDDVTRADYANIIRFARLIGGYPKFVSEHIPNLVLKVMSNSNYHFEGTFKFVNDLPSLSLRAPAFQTMVQVLKLTGKQHSEEMMQVSYWIHGQICNSAQMIVKDIISWLFIAGAKAEIPIPIRNIFWRAKPCSIVNATLQESLDVNRVDLNASCNGGVFASYRKIMPHWILKPNIFENKLVFTVVNMVNIFSANSSEKQYLCESSKSTGICTCDGAYSSAKNLWFIKPVVGGAETFHFQNVISMKYLTAIGDYFEYHEKRKVQSLTVEPKSAWTIKWS